MLVTVTPAVTQPKALSRVVFWMHELPFAMVLCCYFKHLDGKNDNNDVCKRLSLLLLLSASLFE